MTDRTREAKRRDRAWLLAKIRGMGKHEGMTWLLELSLVLNEKHDEAYQKSNAILAGNRRFIFNEYGDLVKVQEVGLPDEKGLRRYWTLGESKEA